MIRLICIPIFIEGTSMVPNALLQRALRYDALAAADIIAEGGFLVSAVTVLYLGFPRLSLPCGLAARATLRGLTTWVAAGFVPRAAPRLRAARDLWPFAIGVLGGQTLVIASQNADYVMVGRLLGGRALGYYSMAWDLLRFIPERLHRVVGRVTLPAFSAIQEQRAQLARHYRALIAMVGLLTPGLALVGLRLAIGSIYYARGWPALDIVLHGLRLIAIVTAILLLAPLGLAAVCAGMSAVEGVVSVAGQWMVCRLIKLSPASLAASTLPGLRTAVACSLAALAGAALFGGLFVSATPPSRCLALVLMLAPAAAVFGWQERRTARSLLRGGDLISSAAEAFGA
jgi:O-antigen/teichoic acid export membrane protein